jgi:elongation factor P
MNVPLKRGEVIRHQDHLWLVDDITEHHSGKQKPTVHVQMHDIADGRHVSRTLDELMPIRPVEFSYRVSQFTYTRGDTWVFMDSETFEEYELRESQLRGAAPFLTSGQEYRVLLAEGRPLFIQLPELVSLHIKSTAAPQHSIGQGGDVLKEAVLENGLTVRVPLFIKNGDLIRVNTQTRAYAGKEKE